jgi:hypothetical protein
MEKRPKKFTLPQFIDRETEVQGGQGLDRN